MAKKGLSKGVKIFIIVWLFIGILAMGIKIYMDTGDITQITGEDSIFCISNKAALDAGYLNGEMTVESLEKSGDFGFGLLADGSGGFLKIGGSDLVVSNDFEVTAAAAEDSITYGRTTQFDTDYAEAIETPASSIDEMLASMAEMRTSQNHIYVYKIGGSSITSITIGPFSSLIGEGTENTKEIASPTGIIYLIWYPPLYQDIVGEYDAVYYDKEGQIGGILLDIEYERLSVAVDLTNSLFLYIPSSEEFQQLDLTTSGNEEITE